MDKVSVIILAAGLGKRMGNSEKPKSLTATCEMTFIEHQLRTISEIKPEKVVVVTGYKRELLEETALDAAKKFKINDINFAFQEKQLGTGDAVKAGLVKLENFDGITIILYGDAPLIRATTLQSLIDFHINGKSEISLITVVSAEENAYGRVIRDSSQKYIQKIVEVKDCTPTEIVIRETNPGIYAVNTNFLHFAIPLINNKNAQQEYYLTDIVEIASANKKQVSPFLINDSAEVQGVNNRFDLALVNREICRRKIKHFIEQGVQFTDFDSVYINGEVDIAPGVKIGPNVQLLGKVTIGEGVVMEGSSILINSTVGPGSLIKLGVRCEDSVIGDDCRVGPFAHIRPGTKLNEHVKIGNFVETKKAVVGKNSAASHLTYLGDCQIGEDTNIGAGTITCNYDGFNKHETKIGDRVFIGSNSALVAPVMIGSDATIGAGSTIVKNVAAGSLALTRPQQVEKSNYQRKKK